MMKKKTHADANNSETGKEPLELNRHNSDEDLIISVDKVIKNILFLCLAIELILILLDLFIAYGKIIPLEDIQIICDLSEEQSLGTWLMVTQNFIAVAVLLLIYFILKKKNKGLLVISLFFLYFSIDDLICIHERSSDILSDLTYYSKTLDNLVDSIFAPFPYYLWHITMGPLFIFIALFMIYFLWKELKDLHLRKYLFLSFLCLINAFIMDFMEGLEKPLLLLSENYSLSIETVQHFWFLTEESLEMFGITIFLFIFLKYLANLLKERTFTFR